jgi:hypothetical protein
MSTVMKLLNVYKKMGYFLTVCATIKSGKQDTNATVLWLQRQILTRVCSLSQGAL